MTTVEDRTDCPHPEKSAYPSKVEAEQAILGVWRKNRGGPKLRVYLCGCGMWHLTSSPDPVNPDWAQADRPDWEFERLVNADLRDKSGTGSAYRVLALPENRVRWLYHLISISESIKVQHGIEKANLDAHPDKPLGGGPTPESYAEAKREMLERKRSRDRTMQAVTERIGEVRRLIGVDILPERAVGDVVAGLATVLQRLRVGEIEDASKFITGMIVRLVGEESGS